MTAERTRGQAAASAAVRAMTEGAAPHAVLLVGPSGIGKTTLAADLAAGLLCTADDPALRPCGACRGCRMVASGNHPDLHRLVPEGAGGQIRIGDRSNPAPGTVRRLVADLALLPVEGGARVAIVEHADRMNEDAQSALLKTLEEPPAGVTIVLCADEDERLLPTVRSRCARVRLGPVPVRDVEAILAERGAVDPPLAARLGRLSEGRPGLALAYALAPDAVTARSEIARSLLDLLDASPGRRLATVAELLKRAAELAEALDGPPRSGRAPARKGKSATVGTSVGATDGVDPDAPAPGGSREVDAAVEAEEAAASGVRLAPAERRRAAVTLLEVWQGVGRDLAIATLGDLRAVRDTELIEDLAAAARGVDRASVATFLQRAATTGELLVGNVGPELAIDVLALAWPRHRVAA